MAEVKHAFYEGSSDVTNLGVVGNNPGGGALEMLGQEFQVTSQLYATKVELYIGEDGTVTDNIICRIETDNGSNKPSGTLVDANATKSISGNINSTKSWETFTFPDNFLLEIGTVYHVVLQRDGADDQNNRVNWDIDNTSPTYAYGDAESRDTSVWKNDVDGTVGVFLFRVYGTLPSSHTHTATATITTTPSASNAVAYVVTASGTVNVTPSAEIVADFTYTATDTVNINPQGQSSQTLRPDYEYYFGTDTGTTHIYSDTYKGDAGAIIACQYVTKNTDFSDQDPLANDRWKTVYAVKLFYEDVYSSTDIVIAISTDGGVTWPKSKSRTLGNGDEKRKDATYYFICTGQFFMFRISSGSASSTFKFLGLEIEYQDAGEHFKTA